MSVQLAIRLSDNLVTLTGLQEATTSLYVNDATVTITVVDASGAELSGETWPHTLDYVAASNGNYQANLNENIAWAHETAYKGKVTALSSGRQKYWEIPIVGWTDSGITPKHSELKDITDDAGIT